MNEVEERILSTLRPHPPTPPNPRTESTEPLMYTGETRDEFYARRQASEGLWNGFLAGISPRGAVFGNDA
jgi:hypothetical protein